MSSGSVTGSGCLHTLGGCDRTNWRGLSSPRLLCLMHALAKLKKLQKLAFEIDLHFNENLEPYVGERQALRSEAHCCTLKLKTPRWHNW